jgi:ABC-2 type transport system permease protein
VVLVVLTPLFFILLYGVSFSSTPQELKIIVVNQDNGQVSVQTQQVGRVSYEMQLANELINNLDSSVFEIELIDDPVVAKQAVENGDAWAALIFPINFSHALINEAIRRSGGPRVINIQNQNVTVVPDQAIPGPLATLILDDSNPQIAAGLLPEINDAFASVLAVAGQQADLAPSSLIEIEPVYLGHVGPLDYTAPGVIGFAITLISIMLTAISIVRERTTGTLTRMLIAPVRAWEVSVGYMLAFLLIALFQAGELLVASVLIFDIRFVGNPVWVMLTILLFSIGLQGVATLVSTLAKNEFQAMQFILVIIIPSIMLTGVFWPIETMPPEIQPLALLNPLTHANSALRDVMLRGWDISAIAPELGVLAGFAIVLLILSIHSMKRQASSS